MYKVDVQKVYDIINNIRKEISDFAENDDMLMSIYNSFDDYMDFDVVEFNYIKKALQVSNDEILYSSESSKDNSSTLYEVDVKKVYCQQTMNWRIFIDHGRAEKFRPGNLGP